MNPIIESFIRGDGGAGYELLKAIGAACADNEQGIQVRPGKQDRYSQDVRKVAARTKATGVIQRRKGYVSFIY